MVKIEGVMINCDVVGDDVELQAVSYGAGSLDVLLLIDQYRISVFFSSVIGFRILGQSDLAEFWTVCSLSNGWLFQISAGGWFEQESIRSGFMSSINNRPKEYLVVTENECVSVLVDEGMPLVERV